MLRELDPIDYPKMLVIERLNPEEGECWKNAGITNERKDDLTLLCDAMKKKHGTDYLGAFAEISKKCVHPNELALCSFFYGYALRGGSDLPSKYM